MASIEEVLQAITEGVAKASEAQAVFTAAASDSSDLADALAGMNAEGTAGQMTATASKLGEVQGHLVAAIEAANEAAGLAQTAKSSSGLTAGGGGAVVSPNNAAAGVYPLFGKPATFGSTTSTDYKKTFFDKHPKLRGEVVVHHAVEQQIQKRHPGLISDAKMHSYENLRGIPKGEVNRRVHLSEIRKSWNRFYKKHPHPTEQQLLDQATVIDEAHGDEFDPPVR